MAIDPDVAERFRPIEAGMAELKRRIEALETRPDNSLFAARDNFETALFSAMQGLADDKQADFLNKLTEQLKGTV